MSPITIFGVDGSIDTVQDMSFEDAQGIVGGWVEAVRVVAGDGTPNGRLLVNEEGRLKGMPENPVSQFFTGLTLVGPVIHVPEDRVSDVLGEG